MSFRQSTALLALLSLSFCANTSEQAKEDAARSKATSTFVSPYSQWANGPSTDPNFFPLAVWLQVPEHVPEFRGLGINLFLGFWGKLDEKGLNEFAAEGMSVVPEQNSLGLRSPQNSWIRGWAEFDEPDNAQNDSVRGYAPCIPPARLLATYQSIRANDATRPVFLGFGRGVADTNWLGRGACVGDTSY